MTVRSVPGPGKAQLDAAALLERFEVRAGWFESSKYADGTPVAYVAAIQEYGYDEGGIPPRSFLRPTIVAKRDSEWIPKTVAMLRRKATAQAVCEAIGATVAADFREAIVAVTTPELAPRTLAARRARGNASTKPLVDTRIMLPTLTHVVEGA